MRNKKESCCFIGFIASSIEAINKEHEDEFKNKKIKKEAEVLAVKGVLQANDKFLRSGNLVKPCPDCGEAMPVPYEEAVEIITNVIHQVFTFSPSERSQPLGCGMNEELSLIFDIR